MIILCTHNNGGVGKTTLAVHVTGVLLLKFPLMRTLLLDCDEEHHAWEFYAGTKPEKDLEKLSTGNLSLIYNKHRSTISNIVDLESYDHIVVDTRGAREDTIRSIINDDPDMILIPVNASQRIKALGNLDRILGMVSQLERNSGFSPQVIIVPLGVSEDIIKNKLEYISRLPHKCKIAKEIRYLQDEMQKALYEDKRYIWNSESCQDLYEDFCSIINL
ncbi:MAG: ParA family protein [Planktothrix sp.]